MADSGKISTFLPASLKIGKTPNPQALAKRPADRQVIRLKQVRTSLLDLEGFNSTKSTQFTNQSEFSSQRDIGIY